MRLLSNCFCGHLCLVVVLTLVVGFLVDKTVSFSMMRAVRNIKKFPRRLEVTAARRRRPSWYHQHYSSHGVLQWRPTTMFPGPSQLWSSFSTVAQPALTEEEDDPQHDEADTAIMASPPPPINGSPHINGSAHITNGVSSDDDSNAADVNGSSRLTGKKAIEEYLKKKSIKSRPVDGGTWDVGNPLGWTEAFGRPSDTEMARVREFACLKPGDEGYFDVSEIKVPGVTIVRTKEEAEIVLEKLQQAGSDLFHACDTEVMEIDLKSVGPVGNGFVTCVSVYSGPDFDYGLGDEPGTTLWIDNLDDSFDVLNVFQPWFENENHLKVWHNYGFDRHVMWNHGIDVKGFGGDTMHMARLQDTSRSRTSGGTGSGYSLEALTEELLKIRKRPMKEIFGVKRLRKDGSEGTLVDIPPVEVMQRDPNHRISWIQYSSYDARGTWMLRDALAKRLEKKTWFANLNLLDYYMEHMRPFGEVLTDMERRGIRVDARDYLAKVEEQARKDRAHHSKVFRKWAAEQIGPDGWALNTASSVQLQTFLFGGSRNSKTGELTESVRLFKVATEEIPEEAIEAYKLRDEAVSGEKTKKELINLSNMKAVKLKALCKERNLEVSGKKADLTARLEEYFLNPSQFEKFAIEVPSDEGTLTTGDIEKMKVTELKEKCKEYKLKVSGKKAELQERLIDYIKRHVDDKQTEKVNRDELDTMSDEDLADVAKSRNLRSNGTRGELLERIRSDIEFVSELLAKEAPQNRDGYVSISEALEAAAKEGGVLAEYLDEFKLKSSETPKYMDVKINSLGKLEPETFTGNGAPSVTAAVLRKLAGDPTADPPKYGTAYKYLGEEGCLALFSLCSIGSIDTMIGNFLTSLQELADEQSRVHCSLNLNTDTGRLSSRRPNLQNQPALEKDKYKIRKAFESSPGNNLIVADYGQLELRILASMTNCKSMIDAFEAGGDFHSRTAVDMFDYIKDKVDSGDVLLEWDYSQGDCPKPLVKDEYASERRKAKTLNFSIAYGKTAHGLSADWGVSQKEANDMLQKWYDARPEVRDWQAKVKQTAKVYGFTRTLMGRYRELPEARMANRKLAGQAERASINTPIQGGAADIAMMAMNKINTNQKLKDLGWILLLQIHDEVILEGPEETAQEAFEVVLDCMQEPWCRGLKETAVPLLVDGSYTHKTWYDAK